MLSIPGTENTRCKIKQANKQTNKQVDNKAINLFWRLQDQSAVSYISLETYRHHEQTVDSNPCTVMCAQYLITHADKFQ